MKSDNEFRRGLIDGIPIGLAYVAVSFAFGISGASKGCLLYTSDAADE